LRYADCTKNMTQQKKSRDRSRSPQQQQQQNEEIPDPVRKFISALSNALENQDISAISSQYEGTFVRVSDKLFRSSNKWPSPKAIESLISNNEAALLLYTQLFYRHIMTNKDLRLDYSEMTKSFDNFVALIDLINREDKLQIPSQWLWDMLEDLVDQFAFFQMYKDKIISKHVGDDEKKKIELAESNTWSFSGVVKILQSCVAAANIELPKVENVMGSTASKKEHVEDKEDFEDVLIPEGQVTIANQRQLMAYFALVSLSRVYAITGDFFSSLAMLGPVPLNRSLPVTRLLSCFLCLYYHMGLSYLMTRRYLDALRTFGTVLYSALRYKKRFSKGPLESIGGYSDKMFALITIAYAITPQRLDDLVLSVIKETYDEKLQVMQSGSDSAPFAEMFAVGSPNFISLSLLGGKNDWISKVFLNDISSRLKLGSLVNTLQLYSTISVEKLAKMMEMDSAAVKSKLYSIKHITHAPRWKGGNPSSGTFESSLNCDFYFTEENLLNISEFKVTRRYGEYFLRHILRFNELQHK
jgi:translation initiation factor 3 subunit L